MMARFNGRPALGIASGRRTAMAGSIATGVIGQATLVISGVVVARALGPEHRGVLALVFVLSALAAQVGSLGVPVSVTYWIAALETNPKALLQSLGRFRRVQLLAVLTSQAALIVAVLEPKSPGGFLWVGFASLAATAAALIQMYGLAVLQGLRRFGAFNVLRSLNAALYLLGVVALWVVDKATLTPVALVFIAASVASAAATSLVVARLGPVGGASDEVPARRLVSFGVRSLVGSSPPVETFRLDQLLVGLVLSPIALGYYVVALAFTNLTRFVAQSIGAVTYPGVAATADRSMRARLIRRDFGLAAVVCGGITLALVVLIPTLLPFFFGSDFEPATMPAQILLVATFFAALRRILIDGTRGSGWPLWGAAAEASTLLALPAIVLAARDTESLNAVSVVVAAANLLGLLIVAPALFRDWHPVGRAHEEPVSLDTDPSPGPVA
jgi:O-antigen/teichoic acid export membrane protein